MTTQVFNPYLPSWEYIPDGEPHVFDGRLYVYGSHDRFGSDAFCLDDYVCWSADPADLTTWTPHGVIYRKDQDPRNPDGSHAMWAPDVAKGPDGRYYLYYCLDYLREIAVAVCDEPAGAYEFLGLVRHADGTVLGQRDGDIKQFDPGVLVDDDGSIWLYSGQGPLPQSPGRHVGRSEVVQLEPDMLTLKSLPVACVPTSETGAGTGFEGHEFFEGSSIRKIGETYYFVYSSVNMHELCYATADRPDGPYNYGGPIVSNGDLNLDGRATRQDAVYPIGNNHGGIECVNGQWYVFFHRQTNGHHFSRQAMAERIEVLPDGSIPQVEITSCGLNGGPLRGAGTYEARICCHLQGPDGGYFSDPRAMTRTTPYVTQAAPEPVEGSATEPVEGSAPEPVEASVPDTAEASAPEPVEGQHVANLHDGATVGWKYFDLVGLSTVVVRTRGTGEGWFDVSSTPGGPVLGTVSIVPSDDWMESSGVVAVPDGISALYLTRRGTGATDLLDLTLT